MSVISCDAICAQFSFSLEVSVLNHETYSHILFHMKETLQGKLMYNYQKYINNATFYNSTSWTQTFLLGIFSMCTIIENK